MNYTLEDYANQAWGRTTVSSKSSYDMEYFTFTKTPANSSSYYTTFTDCFNHILSQVVNTDYANEFPPIPPGLLKFIRALEDSFSCNGVCYPGIFWFTKSVLNPPPTQDCLESILNIFSGKPLGMGILLLFSFLVTLLAHIFSWSVCCMCCAP